MKAILMTLALLLSACPVTVIERGPCSACNADCDDGPDPCDECRAEKCQEMDDADE